MSPSNLKHGDRVTIDVEPLSDRVFRVSDVEVEDIGLTEIVAVTLLTDAESFTLKGTTSGSTFTITDDDTEWSVFDQQIETVK